MKIKTIAVLLIGSASVWAEEAPPVVSTPTTCSYQTWDWNVKRKRSERHRRVTKPYSEVTDVERDAQTGCTVCEEDEVEVVIEGLPTFKICKVVADQAKQAMEAVKASGFPVHTIVSHRVGKTKGGPDKAGYRTGFSRHSFGIAIDINSETNGLYTNCYKWGPSCKKMLGGVWDVTKPGTIAPDSDVVKAFKAVGWKWGGELEGRQKDFMHFSIYGD